MKQNLPLWLCLDPLSSQPWLGPSFPARCYLRLRCAAAGTHLLSPVTVHRASCGVSQGKQSVRSRSPKQASKGQAERHLADQPADDSCHVWNNSVTLSCDLLS